MRIKELFTIPEGEKITEKVFTKVLISSICGILLCMACLVSTTWAWFTVDLENQGNEIQIAKVTADIHIEGAEKLLDGSFSMAAGTYTVDIQLGGDATEADSLRKPLSNIYVVMTVTHDGTADSYYFTFDRQNGEVRKQKEFQVGIGTAKVSFLVSWVQPAGAVPAISEAIVIGEMETYSEMGTTPPTEAPTEEPTIPTESPTETPTEPAPTDSEPMETTDSAE